MNSDYQITRNIGLDRVRYFPRQLITADDMRAEQEYIREKFRRHNRYLHGWGVVCGGEVTAAPVDGHLWQVKIGAGYVITPRGDEILIPDGILFDLAEKRYPLYDPCDDAVPCPPVSRAPARTRTQTVYLAVCYAECEVRPVRMHPAGCGCDDAACEYSRIREGFEFIVLEDLPDSDEEAVKRDKAWIEWVAQDPARSPLPECSTSEEDCVVLASITLPASKEATLDKISYEKRRVLFSYPALQAVLQNLQQTPSSTPAPTDPTAPEPTTPAPSTPASVELTGLAFDLPEVTLADVQNREVTFRGTVSLSGPAPAGDVTIALAEEHTDQILVNLPASVAVAAGQSEASFDINVSRNADYSGRSRKIRLTITATLGNQNKNVTLSATIPG